MKIYSTVGTHLQVAAVDEPKLHLWETGVMRITRHPQAFGQALWCAAHSLWIGSSFMLTTSAALMAHHLFSCWHGDFRLRRKYGEVRTLPPPPWEKTAWSTTSSTVNTAIFGYPENVWQGGTPPPPQPCLQPRPQNPKHFKLCTALVPFTVPPANSGISYRAPRWDDTTPSHFFFTTSAPVHR